MDDVDKLPSFDAGEASRRSTSSLGPMITRLGNILLCLLVALVVGVASCIVTEAARSAGNWSHSYWFWNDVLIHAILIVVGPLAILSLLAIFRPTVSTSLAILISVGWLTAFFAWSAYQTRATYGQFYWPEIWPRYLSFLPIPLSFGLAFGICVRAFLGPNNRLERSRVASSGGQGGSR
jgi:hypothetical protein